MKEPWSMNEHDVKRRFQGLARENGLLDGEQIDLLWDVNLFEQVIGSVYWMVLIHDEFGVE